MNRLAVFVEGQTELLFVEALIRHMAATKNIHIQTTLASGPKGAREHKTLTAASDGGHEFYVLIRDCSGDSQIASDIAEQYPSLAATGYSVILGIRDVRPKLPSDIPRLETGFKAAMRARLGGEPAEVELLLAVMEVEAWFLAEYTHFERLNVILTRQAIVDRIEFDPWIGNAEGRLEPSDDLRRIYDLAALPYEKSRRQVQQTVSVLDYAAVTESVPARVPRLHRLVHRLHEFLSAP